MHVGIGFIASHAGYDSLMVEQIDENLFDPLRLADMHSGTETPSG